ncbi:MAG: GNAT family N-acetyltransferase [Burkholderiaceae bacterium]
MQIRAREALSVRPLTSDDLDQVVAIDALIEGRSRRTYVERRLCSAMREPTLHAQFGASNGDGLAGYLLARVLEGEFGREPRSLRLELLGVRDDSHGLGVGQALLNALTQWAARHDISELRTAATWTDLGMLHWLSEMGFKLAPNHVIDCAVNEGAYLAERDDAIELKGDDEPGNEINFGPETGNDFERMARDTADVRSMTFEDLSDIVRIDRSITGRDRRAYIQSRLAEATDDSSLRISLTARRDDTNVGYLMARVDRGDFGRTEPVAIIDTIGVDPEYSRRGVGHALLSQLFTNLGALRVERVETVVSPGDLALQGLLYQTGFAPSQRLPFVRSI